MATMVRNLEIVKNVGRVSIAQSEQYHLFIGLLYFHIMCVITGKAAVLLFFRTKRFYGICLSSALKLPIKMPTHSVNGQVLNLVARLLYQALIF